MRFNTLWFGTAGVMWIKSGDINLPCHCHCYDSRRILRTNTLILIISDEHVRHACTCLQETKNSGCVCVCVDFSILDGVVSSSILHFRGKIISRFMIIVFSSYSTINNKSVGSILQCVWQEGSTLKQCRRSVRTYVTVVCFHKVSYNWMSELNSFIDD